MKYIMEMCDVHYVGRAVIVPISTMVGLCFFFCKSIYNCMCDYNLRVGAHGRATDQFVSGNHAEEPQYSALKPIVCTYT